MLAKVQESLQSLTKYTENLTDAGSDILKFIRENCSDGKVLAWLEEEEKHVQFQNLLTFFYRTFKSTVEKKVRDHKGKMDIVLVSHGKITGKFVPANGLLPPPNIVDTILYSPWNCKINSYAAYGIATGHISPQNRTFSEAQTIPIPNNWNKLSVSSYPDIPDIILSPIRKSENVWVHFDSLLNDCSRKDRSIILPYLCPKEGDFLPQIPLYVVNFALSYILSILNTRGTIHLAACLGRKNQKVDERICQRQYAYTTDETIMRMKPIKITDEKLFETLGMFFLDP